MQTNKHFLARLIFQKTSFWGAVFFVCALLFSEKTLAQTTGNFLAEKFTGGFDTEKVRAQVSVFSIYKINSKALKAVASADAISFLTIDFAGEHFAGITLAAFDLRSNDYQLVVSGEQRPRPTNISYRGMTDDGGQVVLTIDDLFISGVITMAGEAFYIEPAGHFDAGIEADTYIMYKKEDVVAGQEHECLPIVVAGEIGHFEFQNNQETGPRNPPNGCVTVRLAIASDASMYEKYGSSVAAVIAQTTAVMALVAVDYDSDFNREIQFSIVANLVSINPAVCPESSWGSSLVAGTLLTAFKDWGNSNGCGQPAVTFDLAQLWTNRDLEGSTVGLAYYPGVCSSFKYHILQEFTASMPFLRCMTSHEIGHNFYANHDVTTGHIMAPYVSTATSWSSTSVGEINGREASAPCLLGNLALIGSPLTFFTLPTQWCSGTNIPLNDKSMRLPTSWNWNAPDGTPSVSTVQNAQVMFNSPGLKTVELSTTNDHCGGTATSFVRSVNIIPESYPSGHCNIVTTNLGTANNYGMGIYNIGLAGLTNPTGGAYNDGTAFFDSTCNRLTTLTASSNLFTITVGTANPEKISAWIDFNNDGVFNPATEQIVSSTAGVSGLQSFNFTVPNLPPPNATVTNTLLKMRVMSDFWGSPTPLPCVATVYGQTEDYGVIIATSALPIELTDFSVKKSPTGAMLHWRTLSESNNAYFLVEKSPDGARFEEIGKMAGAGNSIQPLEYHLHDATPWPGTNYYRLAQVDFDGGKSFSNIVQIDFAEETDDLDAIVSPNPIHEGVVRFRMFSENDGAFSADVFDLTGQLFFSKMMEANAGWGDFELRSADLPTGQLLLVLKNAERARVVKVLN